jgi:hypothetical protein
MLEDTQQRLSVMMPQGFSFEEHDDASQPSTRPFLAATRYLLVQPLPILDLEAGQQTDSDGSYGTVSSENRPRIRQKKTKPDTQTENEIKNASFMERPKECFPNPAIKIDGVGVYGFDSRGLLTLGAILYSRKLLNSIAYSSMLSRYRQIEDPHSSDTSVNFPVLISNR